MKKIITLLVFTTISTLSFSQNFFGANAGFNYSTIKGNSLADSVTISYNPGYRAGIMSEIAEITENLVVQIGVDLTIKGYKAKSPDESDVVSLAYLEIPLNLVKKIPLGEGNIKFIVGGGLYAGFGIDFKVKQTFLRGFSAGQVSINNGDFADYDSRIVDIGLTALAGFQFGEKIQVAASFQPGLTSVFYSVNFGTVKNRSFCLKVSYSW